MNRPDIISHIRNYRNELLKNKEIILKNKITELLSQFAHNEEFAANEETKKMICNFSSNILILPSYVDELTEQQKRIQEVKQEEPQWVMGEPLPFLKDLNKVGRWTVDCFSKYTIKMKLKSYMWFKFKCIRNKTGRCFKTFYRDIYGGYDPLNEQGTDILDSSIGLFTTFTELKEHHRKHYGEDTKPDYGLSEIKRSIHYNGELDLLYIGGGGTGFRPMRIEIIY